MVAAGGAGLNINPRGRPGHTPVLVRFRFNSRNHAAKTSSRARRKQCPRKTKNARANEQKDQPKGEPKVDQIEGWQGVVDHAVNRVGRAGDRQRRRCRRR